MVTPRPSLIAARTSMVAESSACSGLKVGAQVFECCGYGV
jgi:hypothetical protein